MPLREYEKLMSGRNVAKMRLLFFSCRKLWITVVAAFLFQFLNASFENIACKDAVSIDLLPIAICFIVAVMWRLLFICKTRMDRNAII